MYPHSTTPNMILEAKYPPYPFCNACNVATNPNAKTWKDNHTLGPRSCKQ